MKYIVMEIQKTDDNTLTHLEDIFDTRAEAESKYYYVLSYAAVSTLRLFSVVLLNEYGELISSKFYENVPAPEPKELEE